MYDVIAIRSERFTHYILTDAYEEIYSYLLSLGLSHDSAAEVSSWASLASHGKFFDVCGIHCEIRSCGDSNI